MKNELPYTQILQNELPYTQKFRIQYYETPHLSLSGEPIEYLSFIVYQLKIILGGCGCEWRPEPDGHRVHRQRRQFSVQCPWALIHRCSHSIGCFPSRGGPQENVCPIIRHSPKKLCSSEESQKSSVHLRRVKKSQKALFI